MELVEFYRIRRAMFWYAGILAAIVILNITLGEHTKVAVDGQTQSLRGVTFPLLLGGPIAMFCAATFATVAALALNRENSTLEFAWTKPIARSAIALRYILIDVAAIVLAFALAWAAVFAILARLGAAFASSPDLFVTIALSLGVALMWYGLLLALTAGFSSRASLIVGFAWPVSAILGNVQNAFGGIVGAVVHVLNVVNPFAYISGFSAGTDRTGQPAAVTIHSAWAVSNDARAAIVWTLFVIFCTLATVIWSRREA
jgi:hypothetical protein